MEWRLFVSLARPPRTRMGWISLVSLCARGRVEVGHVTTASAKGETARCRCCLAPPTWSVPDFVRPDLQTWRLTIATWEKGASWRAKGWAGEKWRPQQWRRAPLASRRWLPPSNPERRKETECARTFGLIQAASAENEQASLGDNYKGVPVLVSDEICFLG
jgi:hypothetical protein